MKTYLNITPEELYDVRKKVSNRVLNSMIDINNSPSKKEVLLEIVRTKEAIEHLLNILFESKYPIVDKSMLVSKDLVDCFVDIIVLNHYIVNKFESEYCDTNLYVCDSRWDNNDVRNSEDAALMLMDKIHMLNDIFREFLLNINNVPNMISMRLDTSRRYDVTFSNSCSNRSSYIYKNNEMALSFNMWLMTHCRWIYNIVNKLGLFKEKSCTITDSGNAKISAYSSTSSDANESVNGRMFDINMNINHSKNAGIHYESDSTSSLVEQMLDAAYNVAIASLAAHADDKYFSSEDE